MSNQYPFENLVFEGGGVRGIAYLGALEVLDRQGILKNIKRTAGTSAGAITALITSFGLDSAQMGKILATLDFSKVPGKGEEPPAIKELPKEVRKILDDIFGDFEGVARLIHDYGWYSTEYFYEWLQAQVKDRTGNPLATFGDFRKQGLYDLHVVSTDLSTRKAVIFSADSYPQMPVALAVRMSMSIPLFFQSIQITEYVPGNKDHFVDGGVLNNFPIQVFDDAKYVGDPKNFQDGVNRETLGLSLYTAESCSSPKPITNMITYIEALFESLLNAQSTIIQLTPSIRDRTLPISDCCVPVTNFNIKQGDPQYNDLIDSGRKATEAYLQNWKPSV